MDASDRTSSGAYESNVPTRASAPRRGLRLRASAPRDKDVLERSVSHAVKLVAVDRNFAGSRIDGSVSGRRGNGIELCKVGPQYVVHVTALSGNADILADRVLLVRRRRGRRPLDNLVGQRIPWRRGASGDAGQVNNGSGIDNAVYGKYAAVSGGQNLCGLLFNNE